MEIRPAGPADIPAMAALLAACKASMARQGIHQWDAEYPLKRDAAGDVAAQSAYLLCQEAFLAAMVTLDHAQPAEYDPLPWTFSAERMLVVHRLAVHPRRQGQGLAKRLMGFAEDLGRQQGCQTVRLDAFAHNPAALALYRGLGYRWVGAVTFRRRTFYCYEKGLL